MALQRVLVANRGEIAVRIIRACHALGIEAVLAASKADLDSRAAQLADRTVCIGGPRSPQSYLRPEYVVSAATGTGCDAVHPGYGFMAESAAFAAHCRDNDLIFVGPSPETIAAMGDKLQARAIATEAHVPIVPGSEQMTSVADAATFVKEIGLPVLLKASAGGGGRGIRIVRQHDELERTFQDASAEAESAFGNGAMFIERYIENGRHIEVQVLGDGTGKVLHLGERDCSVQRRYQKIIEESPGAHLTDELRAAIHHSAVMLASHVNYENAGTVEFILDRDRDEFHFLEMNTRIQVEHPVTEQITGVDLVQHQLQIAGGAPLNLSQDDVTFDGHAIEVRITAESAENDFRPSPGRINVWDVPSGDNVRVDTHCYSGYTVPPFYDSMLAKVIAHGKDRDAALDTLATTLDASTIEGIDTNVALLAFMINHDEFKHGGVNTRWGERVLTEFNG